MKDLSLETNWASWLRTENFSQPARKTLSKPRFVLRDPVTQPQPIPTAYQSMTGTRPTNEDRIADFDSPFGHVWGVADGMGGHAGGEEAAKMVLGHIRQELGRVPLSWGPAAALREAARAANSAIYERGRTEPALFGMGATAVLAIRTEGGVCVGHAGDCRAYLWRRGALTQLTRDHTPVEELLQRGEITEREARKHPLAHVINRGFGPEHDLALEINTHVLEPGDRIVLCSDGFWGSLTDDEIESALAAPESLDKLASSLAEQALSKGSMDNVSVLIFEEPDAPIGSSSALPRDGAPTQVARTGDNDFSPRPFAERFSRSKFAMLLLGIILGACLGALAMRQQVETRLASPGPPASQPPLPHEVKIRTELWTLQGQSMASAPADTALVRDLRQEARPVILIFEETYASFVEALKIQRRIHATSGRLIGIELATLAERGRLSGSQRGPLVLLLGELDGEGKPNETVLR